MYLQLDMGTEWYFVEIGHAHQYITSLSLHQQLNQFWIVCWMIWPYKSNLMDRDIEISK